jgi:hypothetical protein
MKIALTLSGQPRNYRIGFKELKKWFLDKYDIDVYMHSWIGKEFYKYDFFDKGKLVKTYKPSLDSYKELVNLYQPKQFLFEPEITFDSSATYGYLNQRLNSQLSMFCSLKRVWDLVEETGIEYDLIIRARYDLLFTHHVSYDCVFLKDLSLLNPNQVNYFRYAAYWRSGLGINDIFAVGGYDVMKTYHNLFPSQIYYQFLDPDYLNWMQGLDKYINETLLMYHLNKNKIKMHGIDSGELTRHHGPMVIR